MSNKSPICQHEGCEKDVWMGSLCRQHYAEHQLNLVAVPKAAFRETNDPLTMSGEVRQYVAEVCRVKYSAESVLVWLLERSDVPLDAREGIRDYFNACVRKQQEDGDE